MSRKRVILELLVLIFLILISFFTNDIQATFLGVNQLEFILISIVISFFLRVLFSLIIMVTRYNRELKQDNKISDLEKLYFENGIYKHLSIIFFILIFSNTLNVAFILLFLVFSILWMLSKLSIISLRGKDNKKLKKLKLIDSKYAEMYGNTKDDFYNFMLIKFYSDLGFEFFKVLTDNTFGILNNYNDENSIILLDKLSKSNYLFLVPRSLFFGDVNLLCGVINSYLEKLDINCKIDPKEILERDTEQLSNRRRDYLDTLCNDLEIIDVILKKKKYRIISIGVDDGTETYLCFSVVSNDVYKKIKNYIKK